jgi:hypothetical protein
MAQKREGIGRGEGSGRDLDVALAVDVVHEVELLLVDGVRAAGPHAERVQRHVPARSTETT